MSSILRNTSWVTSIGALFALTGCAGGVFGGSSGGYDEQGCVETAIRRNPDQASLAGARKLFDQACSLGDPAACSALGVLFETGRGAPKDTKRAARLFHMACYQGNSRGCTNLGLLLEHGVEGNPSPRMARDLYERACDANERSGCANLGRLYKEGKVVPRDFAFASDLLGKACTQGETAACLDLAELVAERSPDQSLALFVNACVAGEPSACARLKPDAPRAKPVVESAAPTVASK